RSPPSPVRPFRPRGFKTTDETRMNTDDQILSTPCRSRESGNPAQPLAGVSPGYNRPAPLRAARRDEGVEDLGIAGADRIFGVPLHGQAEAVFRVLDALDDTVFGEGVDHDSDAEVLGRLMVGAVDLQLVGLADAVQ